MILDDTWQNRCRVAQGSCLIRIQLRNPCYGVLLPVVLAKTCLRRNMANAAHFTPTGPTISSGCSGATYAAHLAHQHQKAAPVPPAHTCGLRYERSTAGWCAEAAGAALVLIPCAYTEASRLCTQALNTHRVCHGLTDLWAYR